MKSVDKIIERLDEVSVFISALPMTVEGSEILHAIRSVLAEHPRKFKAFCEAVSQELGEDEDDEV